MRRHYRDKIGRVSSSLKSSGSGGTHGNSSIGMSFMLYEHTSLSAEQQDSIPSGFFDVIQEERTSGGGVNFGRVMISLKEDVGMQGPSDSGRLDVL